MRFNVAFEESKVNIVVCGRVITVRIPVVTNTDDLEAGEELVMQVQVKKKIAAPTDWRNSEQKSAKTKPPQQQKPKSEFDDTGRQDI